MMQTPAGEVKPTICRICACGCGLDVLVNQGKIVSVQKMDRDLFGHRPCVRGLSVQEWVYHPERITEPLRRIGGRWHQVSWDEALGHIAGKLETLKREQGARSLAVHLGYPTQAAPVNQNRVAQRFCDAYGSPNYTTLNSVCSWAHHIAQSITFNHDITFVSADYHGTQCIVLWGTNPSESSFWQLPAIRKAQAQGSKLIVIDPRKIPVARRADIYAQIRPGTDAALALGMLNVIIGEQLFDKGFVDEWTHGFEELSEHVKQYALDRVAEITWVQPDTIRNMARTYATSKPACINHGEAADHGTNGVQTVRAICSLIAVCGNFDVEGGDSFSLPPQPRNLRLRQEIHGELGAAFPLFTRFVGESSSSPLAEAILTGDPYRINALIVQGSNAAVTWPQSKKAQQALRQLDLLVVMDMFMTETARLADVFLPAATFLESTRLKYFGTSESPLAVLTRPVIKPLGSAWPDWRFWSELGKRMGLEQAFPWSRDEEFYATVLDVEGLEVACLDEAYRGIGALPKRAKRKYLTSGFNTPSGKVELYSELLAQQGHDPLPTYREPAESPISDPETAREYPLILTSGPRVKEYMHSQLRNVPRLRRRRPDPLAQIHPETARALGIADGDNVRVETRRGDARLVAQVTDAIHPMVVSIPLGWEGEANANLLTDSEAVDPISGFPAYKALLCRIARA